MSNSRETEILAEYLPALGATKLIDSVTKWVKDPAPHGCLHWHDGFGDDLPALRNLEAGGFVRFDKDGYTVWLTKSGRDLWVKLYSDVWPRA